MRKSPIRTYVDHERQKASNQKSLHKALDQRNSQPIQQKPISFSISNNKRFTQQPTNQTDNKQNINTLNNSNPFLQKKSNPSETSKKSNIVIQPSSNSGLRDVFKKQFQNNFEVNYSSSNSPINVIKENKQEQKQKRDQKNIQKQDQNIPKIAIQFQQQQKHQNQISQQKEELNLRNSDNENKCLLNNYDNNFNFLNHNQNQNQYQNLNQIQNQNQNQNNRLSMGNLNKNTLNYQNFNQKNDTRIPSYSHPIFSHPNPNFVNPLGLQNPFPSLSSKDSPTHQQPFNLAYLMARHIQTQKQLVKTCLDTFYPQHNLQFQHHQNSPHNNFSLSLLLQKQETPFQKLYKQHEQKRKINEILNQQQQQSQYQNRQNNYYEKKYYINNHKYPEVRIHYVEDIQEFCESNQYEYGLNKKLPYYRSQPKINLNKRNSYKNQKINQLNSSRKVKYQNQLKIVEENVVRLEENSIKQKQNTYTNNYEEQQQESCQSQSSKFSYKDQSINRQQILTKSKPTTIINQTNQQITKIDQKIYQQKQYQKKSTQLYQHNTKNNYSNNFLFKNKNIKFKYFFVFVAILFIVSLITLF